MIADIIQTWHTWRGATHISYLISCNKQELTDGPTYQNVAKARYQLICCLDLKWEREIEEYN